MILFSFSYLLDWSMGSKSCSKTFCFRPSNSSSNLMSLMIEWTVRCCCGRHGPEQTNRHLAKLMRHSDQTSLLWYRVKWMVR
uniref:Uncharacterized protein n=1 Tax=Kalanchoe fedtschenkoi TaxID=63787 RepID=A0A7N0UVM8_KALFE